MLRLPRNGYPRVPFVPGFMIAETTKDEFVYAPAQLFADSYKKTPGQIRRGTPFGDQLYALAQSSPRLWLEVGTWNGLGSTQCILDGFANRTDKPFLLSLEVDPFFATIAKENIGAHVAGSTAHVACGRLGSTKRLAFPTIVDLPEEEKNTGHFILYYEQELNLYHTSDQVIPSFAPQVAVLDGGEYSGGLDWEHLDKSNLQYLCLDDAGTYKNKAVLASLGPSWTLVARGDDRNGWAIYKRV